MFRKLHHSLLLVLVLLLAAFLRLYNLDTLPISLFGDEVDVGYHAWSLATTGRDYMGNLLPSYIHSLSEYRAPLLMYVTAPFIAVLGPTPFAVRLPVALLGVANVYLLCVFTNLLFPTTHIKLFDRKLSLGLLAAAFLAVTPWHLHYSRVAFESTLLLTLLLWGAVWFIKSASSRVFPFLLFPLPFVLAFYTYSTANIFVPLFGLGLLMLFPRFLPEFASHLRRQKPRLLYLLLPLLLLLPIALKILSGPAANRFQLISIFNDQTLVDQIINLRTQPWVDQAREAVFHNKPLAISMRLFSQYLESLSPEFLFLRGDQFLRHSVGEYGQLLLATAPFLLIGMAVSVASLFDRGFSARHRLRRRSVAVVLLWLVISPLPSALTVSGGYHATRLILMLPPLIILTAIGLRQLIAVLSGIFSPIAFTLTLLVLALNFAGFWHYYSAHYRYLSAPLWHSGYREIFAALKPYVSDSERRIYINNTFEPSLLRFAFFTQIPPADFQRQFTTDVPDQKITPAFTGFPFGDHIFFGELDSKSSLTDLLLPGDLYVAAQLMEVPGDWDWQKSPPAGLTVLKAVRNPYGQPQFYLVARN